MNQTDLWWRLVADGRRAPGSKALTRRIDALCELEPQMKVLTLGGGEGALALQLARERECQMFCVEVDDGALAELRERAAESGLGERIVTVSSSLPMLPAFETGPLDAVVAEAGLGMLEGSFVEAAAALRGLLAPGGKLALVTRARVGRTVPRAVDAHYRERGLELLSPGQLLGELERAGFEPLATETLSEESVEAYHQALEERLPALLDGELAQQIQAALELHRREGGRNAVQPVLLVARRKEPGEQPPESRRDG